MEQTITTLANRGLGFGVHVVLTAVRWAEIRINMRDLLGTKLELRLGDASESEGDAYMRFVGARYELLRTHDWSGEMIDRLQGVERRRRGRRRHRGRWTARPRPR